ncbi:MAG: hypothetical protein V4773_23830 [Verrucomicrobiota bacterium]
MHLAYLLGSGRPSHETPYFNLLNVLTAAAAGVLIVGLWMAVAFTLAKPGTKPKFTDSFWYVAGATFGLILLSAVGIAIGA